MKSEEKNLRNFLNSCIKKNILKEYIEENYDEVLDILLAEDSETELLNDEIISDNKKNFLTKKGADKKKKLVNKK